MSEPRRASRRHSGRGCAEWRGELAARVLGVADPDVAAALDAHLDGCPACRAELEELRETAAALSLAEPDGDEVRSPMPALADEILRRIGAERAAGATRRRHRVLAAVIGAAAAVVAVVVVIAVGNDDGGPTGIELAGDAGARGDAVLAARPWGTEITLEVEGLTAGEVYWLWLTGDDGERITAGTLTGTGEASHAVLAAALPADEARRIWMTDEEDEVVLDALIARVDDR